MNREENNKQIAELAQRLNMKFPSSYVDFLSEIDNGDVFEIEGTGICMYSYADLEERNLTYEVEAFEPNYFMLGQAGDLAYFIRRDNPNDDSIYSNDLGALGASEMKKEADDILRFIALVKEK